MHQCITYFVLFFTCLIFLCLIFVKINFLSVVMSSSCAYTVSTPGISVYSYTKHGMQFLYSVMIYIDFDFTDEVNS